MEITLSEKESEEFFYNSLCNAVGTGYINGHGIRLECKQKDYDLAKAKLHNPCYEDVLMQILRDGAELTIIDESGDVDMTSSITMKDVHEKVAKTPIRHLSDMINENDDAETADAIIQTVFFGEIVFG